MLESQFYSYLNLILDLVSVFYLRFACLVKVVLSLQLLELQLSNSLVGSMKSISHTS